jgi:hypothetical protein
MRHGMRRVKWASLSILLRRPFTEAISKVVNIKQVQERHPLDPAARGYAGAGIGRAGGRAPQVGETGRSESVSRSRRWLALV